MPSRSRGTDEWRPIPGYDGYEITRTGRVRSITPRDRLQVRIHNDFDIVIEYVDDLVRLTYDQP
jgi:hypothetical protein